MLEVALYFVGGFVVGAVAGILFTNNNVKKVQATLDYFEQMYEEAVDRSEELADRVLERNQKIAKLEANQKPVKATVKKAAT